MSDHIPARKSVRGKSRDGRPPPAPEGAATRTSPTNHATSLRAEHARRGMRPVSAPRFSSSRRGFGSISPSLLAPGKTRNGPRKTEGGSADARRAQRARPRAPGKGPSTVAYGSKNGPPCRREIVARDKTPVHHTQNSSGPSVVARVSDLTERLTAGWRGRIDTSPDRRCTHTSVSKGLPLQDPRRGESRGKEHRAPNFRPKQGETASCSVLTPVPPPRSFGTALRPVPLRERLADVSPHTGIIIYRKARYRPFHKLPICPWTSPRSHITHMTCRSNALSPPSGNLTDSFPTSGPEKKKEKKEKKKRKKREKREKKNKREEKTKTPTDRMPRALGSFGKRPGDAYSSLPESNFGVAIRSLGYGHQSRSPPTCHAPRPVQQAQCSEATVLIPLCCLKYLGSRAHSYVARPRPTHLTRPCTELPPVPGSAPRPGPCPSSS